MKETLAQAEQEEEEPDESNWVQQEQRLQPMMTLSELTVPECLNI